MKAVWCVGVVVVVLMAVVVEGKHVESVSWIHIDLYVQSVWEMAAAKYAMSVCQQPDELVCYERLPECRSLLYYVYPFTDEVYDLLLVYMRQCSNETNAGWNVSALPTKLDKFYEIDENGIEDIYNMGLDPDNMSDMFVCVEKKFNNPQAFKDCMNM